MDIFEFALLSLCNVALLLWLVKRQGMASVEGYCAAFLAVAALTDNVNLVFDYVMRPGKLLLGADEFAFRVFPTEVHIAAVLVLMAGLFLANPRPEPTRRELTAAESGLLTYIGVALVILGLLFTGITIYLTQAYSAGNFFEALDQFRGGDPGEAGGFMVRGADIAVFGLALVLSSVRKMGALFVMVLLAMMLVSLFLRPNKGGLELPILWTALVLYTYNPVRFWSLAKARIVLPCLVLAVLGISLKSNFLQQETMPWTLETWADRTLGPLQARWGDEGLYRGYCQFIQLVPKYHYLFDGYAEGMYALTEAWIPRAIHPNKGGQPTRGLGFMIHADEHTFPDETPSLELVGSAYADQGFYSLTVYLLIVGFVLGALRRYATARGSTLHWHVSYLCFALFGGLSAEAGITTIIYTFLLTFGATGFAYLAVAGLYNRKLRVGLYPPIHCPVRSSVGLK